jgi:hypothetical protein
MKQVHSNENASLQMVGINHFRQSTVRIEDFIMFDEHNLKFLPLAVIEFKV